jgi:hypothetical protein
VLWTIALVMAIDVELREMTWEQIEPNLLKWRAKFHKQLDVEQRLKTSNG